MPNPLVSPYIPNIPQANQQINNTQQPIENNFQDIASLIGVNHIPFNTANDFGKHNFVTYYNQSSIPGAGTNEMVMFSQTGSTGTQLYYQYPNSSTVNQLTGSGSGVNGNGVGFIYSSSSGAYGYQYLAGSILMAFGQYTLTAVPSTNITYSGTQIFDLPPQAFGGGASFTQAPFYIEIISTFIGTGGIPATQNSYSTGLVQAQIISSTQFSITIQNSSSNSFRVMVIGI